MRLSRKRKGLPCEMASGKTENLHGKSERLSDGTGGSCKGSSPALPRGNWTGSLEKRRGINREACEGVRKSYTPDGIGGNLSAGLDREWAHARLVGGRSSLRFWPGEGRLSVERGEEKRRPTKRKSERRGQEKFSTPPPDFRLFDLLSGWIAARKRPRIPYRSDSFSTRTRLAECPCRHNRRLVISPDTPRSSPYPFP